MKTFRGLVYVRHGRVGTRSEGPDYMLQTYKGDYLLALGERYPWAPDYQLEFYGRKMVEIEGELIDGQTIKVSRIEQILSPMIPRPEHHAPHTGEPFELRFGQRVHLADAPLDVEFLTVQEDSRCPIGVTCVWAGRCTVTLALTPEGQDGQKVDLTIQPGDPKAAIAELLGYQVELHAVKPHPTKATPQPTHSLYTVVIELHKSA